MGTRQAPALPLWAPSADRLFRTPRLPSPTETRRGLPALCKEEAERRGFSSASKSYMLLSGRMHPTTNRRASSGEPEAHPPPPDPADALQELTMVLPSTLRGNEGCAEPGKASRDLSRTRTAKRQPCQHALGAWGPRRHSCRALRARCAQSTGPRGSKGRLPQSTCSQGSALWGKNQPGGDKAPTEWAQQVGAKGQAGQDTCKPQAGALGQEQGLGMGGAGLPALGALTPQLLTSPKLPIWGRRREPQGPGA